jgi:hypothetical protein
MIGEPIVTVTCDQCGTADEFGLTALARGSYDERSLPDDMRAAGWVFDDSDSLTYCCQDCANAARV